MAEKPIYIFQITASQAYFHIKYNLYIYIYIYMKSNLPLQPFTGLRLAVGKPGEACMLPGEFCEAPGRLDCKPMLPKCMPTVKQMVVIKLSH